MNQPTIPEVAATSQLRNRSYNDMRSRNQDGSKQYTSRPTSLHIAQNQPNPSDRLQSPQAADGGSEDKPPVFQHQMSTSSTASRPDSRRSVSSGSRPPSRPCSRPGSATSVTSSNRHEFQLRQEFHTSSPDFFKPFQSLKNPGYSTQQSMEDVVNRNLSPTSINNNNNYNQRDEKSQRKSSNVSNKSLPENRVANFGPEPANFNTRAANNYHPLPIVTQNGTMEENIYCNVNQGFNHNYNNKPSCKYFKLIFIENSVITTNSKENIFEENLFINVPFF
ncbi:MAG: hypothetical protein GY696_00645 [Gammaproteobacteria bacterium]|nr:hypothetical protein [Gammaproteobacteria bacterium]